MRPALLLVALGLAACGDSPPPAPAGAVAARLATEVVQPVNVPAERELDGAIEAVNQATVSAQTSGGIL